MKAKYLRFLSIAAVAATVALASCIGDLDTTPLDKDIVTSEVVYKDLAGYTGVLAKVYAGLALSGQQGPAGNADISGIDEGFSTYIRQYWKHQELTTDEAVIAWNDGTIQDFHQQDWSSGGEFIRAMYNRIYYQITLCNEFIRESAPQKLSDRGFSDADKTTVAGYRAEARFMRALSYYHAMDMFGNVPFITEADGVGSFLPTQIAREDLFTYLETELKELESLLPAARTNQYGRADAAAAQMLLAKMYLNAKVYTGTEMYTECITFTKKVLAAGYTLNPVYANNFVADNNTSPEFIFAVNFDGDNSRTWGGMTFVIHAAVGGSMNIADYGIDGGWGGTRVTAAFVDKFADPSGATDKRAMFYTAGQSKGINDIGTFTDGYAITKFKNKTAAGANGKNLTYVDTDWPVFRLAEAHLMLAEAVVRGGTGATQGDALNSINALRLRAYGDATGNITAGELTLDFILDERARELYWEGHRRTDLIRFGKFSNSTYVWPWKGGAKDGISVDAKYDLFPIPADDLGANPNLVQNPGY